MTSELAQRRALGAGALTEKYEQALLMAAGHQRLQMTDAQGIEDPLPIALDER